MEGLSDLGALPVSFSCIEERMSKGRGISCNIICNESVEREGRGNESTVDRQAPLHVPNTSLVEYC